jgi:hypothetical protein
MNIDDVFQCPKRVIAGVKIQIQSYFLKKTNQGAIAASFCTFLFTFESNYSVLALIGSLASTYGAFQREDLRLRKFMFVGTLSWLIFNLITYSPLAVVRQSLFALSNLVGFWRFYRRFDQVSDNE